VAAPKPAAGLAAGAATRAVGLSGTTVLVVDDEPTVRNICRAALQKSGCSVLLAEDGPSGLRLIEERGADIRLVLLDLGMPGMSGRQMLEKVRASGSRLPVIVFSGYSEREVAREFEGLGVARFLQKPFPSTRLAAMVAETLETIETGRRLEALPVGTR
jgi:DNA-binding NtrC family response regulator